MSLQLQENYINLLQLMYYTNFEFPVNLSIVLQTSSESGLGII